MNQVNKIRYKRSLPNSKKSSLLHSTKNSLKKIQKFKQSMIKPLNNLISIQKGQKVSPYFPKTRQNKQKSNSYTKTLQKSTIDATQKLVSNKMFPDRSQIYKRIKSNNIRIKTEAQKIQDWNTKQRSIQRNNYKRQSKQLSAILLTKYQQNQSKIYEIYYVSKRRIKKDQDFTNKNGDPIVKIGDSIIFRYQILSQLGHGSFGYVFKACDHKRNQIVALKIIKNHYKYQKQAKVQINILEYAVNQDHKDRNNIVRIKHAFLFRGHHCIVFQLLSINLFQFCKQIKFIGLPLTLIRKFSIQILQALNFLEKHQIIHCDVKPENILLRKQNKTSVKLIDFGSGCFDGKQIYNYIQIRYYRAPQILLGTKYTYAIDLWSFGCVIAQLFNGCPLFPGQDEQDQMILFVQILGLPPSKLLEDGTRIKRFFVGTQLKQSIKTKNRVPASRPLSKVLRRCPEPLFIDFVYKFVMWVPQQRMRASQALLHPWILQGVPQQLQNEHEKLI